MDRSRRLVVALLIVLGLALSVLFFASPASAAPNTVSGVACKANYNTTDMGAFTRGFWIRCNYGGYGLTSVVVACQASGGVGAYIQDMTTDVTGGAVGTAFFPVSNCSLASPASIVGVNYLTPSTGAHPDCATPTSTGAGRYCAVSWAITATAQYPVTQPTAYGSIVGFGDDYSGDGVCSPALTMTPAEMAGVAIEAGIPQSRIARLIAYTYPVTGGLVGYQAPTGPADGVGVFDVASLVSMYDSVKTDPWLAARLAKTMMDKNESDSGFAYRSWQFNGFPPDSDDLAEGEAALADPDFGMNDRCEGSGGTGDSPHASPPGGGTACTATETFTLNEMAFALQNAGHYDATPAELVTLLSIGFSASAGAMSYSETIDGARYAGSFATVKLGGIPTTGNVYTEAQFMRHQFANVSSDGFGLWAPLRAVHGATENETAAAAALAAPTVPHCGVPADGDGPVGGGGGGGGGSCSLLDVGCQLERLFDSLFGIINRALTASFVPSDAAVSRFVSDLRGAYEGSAMEAIVDFATVPSDAVGSLADGAGSNCGGIEVDIVGINTTVMDSCSGPLQTIRTVVVIGGTATIYLLAAFLCFRLVSAPFGVRGFGGGD